MEVQLRVLRWHHTSYLIIISQTISRLIVIGGISEHIGEVSGLVGGHLHSLAFSRHSRVLISPRCLPPNTAASAASTNKPPS